jgi:sporulation protein YlmC with PRC-barrel domain
MRLAYDELKGRTVMDATGNAIGEVEGLFIEQATSGEPLCVSGMRVKLRSAVADSVGIQHGAFRPAVIEIPAAIVQAIGDAVLLSVKLNALLQPAPTEHPASH